MSDKFGVKEIYPTNGNEWYNKWDNGHSRTLKQNMFDPDDPKFGFHVPTSRSVKLNIDGNGKANLPLDMGTDNSQRMFISGSWLNTEMTLYIKYRTRIWHTFQMRNRANHHGTKNLPYGYNSDLEASCGFGNYEVIWGNNEVRHSIEVIHDVYSSTLKTNTSNNPQKYKWIGHKIITYNTSKGVKVEAWTDFNADQNWKKESDYTYDGSIINLKTIGKEDKIAYCIDKGDKISNNLQKNTVWKNPSKWCWIRINGGCNFDLKWFSVREIIV